MSSQIRNEFDFIRGMLIWMMMWSSRMIKQRFDRAVIAPFPTLNILSVGLVFNGSFGDTIFLGVTNQ